MQSEFHLIHTLFTSYRCLCVNVAQLVEQGEKSKRETAALEGRIVHGKHRLAAVEQQLAQVTAERESLRSQASHGGWGGFSS